MSITIDSISIKGLRKTHLSQLVNYIHARDDDGWYYGNREQFEQRHADLLELANKLKQIVDDPDIVIAKK